MPVSAGWAGRRNSVEGWQAQGCTRLGGEGAADDQRNAAAGANLVENDIRLDLEFGDDLAVLQGLAFDGAQLDLVAHLHLRNVEFNRQGAGILHGVEEDRRDLGSKADAAEALVRHIGDVFACEPQHRVGGGLARRAGADDIANVGDEVALGAQGLQQLERANLAGLIRLDAGTRILQHGQRVQRDIGAGPGVGRGREVVGVGLAANLEDRDGEAFRHAGARGEPLGIGPRLHDSLGVTSAGVAGFGQLLHIVEVVEHQKRVLQRMGSRGAAFGASQEIDQRLDVEAAQHGAQEFRRADLGDRRARLLALGDFRKELGFDLGGVVHARRHAVGKQLDEERFLARWRIFQQGNQFGGLPRRQRQGRNPEGGAFGGLGTVGFEHGQIL